MASATRITRYTPEQYLAMERKADFKSEYDSGFITAMAGASDQHNAISVNMSREIQCAIQESALPGLCERNAALRQ